MKRISLLLLLTMACLAYAGNGKVFLGVKMDEAGNIGGGGAVVAAAVEGSAADEAGIRKGDKIIRINDMTISGNAELIETLQSFSAGDKVNVVILRGDSTENVEVILDERPERDVQRRVFVASQTPWMGIEIEPLGDQMAEFFRVEGGILVKRVEADSPAMAAGLKAGDVITTLNGNPVLTSQEFFHTLSEFQPEDQIDVGIQRRDELLALPLTLGENNIKPADVFFYQMPDSSDLQFSGTPKVFHFKPGDMKDELETLREQIQNLQKQLEDRK